MAGPRYAVLTDIVTFGLPINATETLSDTQKQAQLDVASAEMDNYFRARYTLPFISFGIELTKHCVWIAQFYLMTQRGYLPQAGSDKTIRDRYDLAIKWLVDVRDQKLHPDVVDQTTKLADQPVVSSNTPFVPPFPGVL